MDALRFDDLMISWAQRGEDVVLRRALGDAPPGFWIDVGANDPEIDSVTKYFSLRGWCGVNVEPVSSLHHRLRVLLQLPRNGKMRKLISLYSGAGGMDYGFEAAGFATAVALEFDHD